MTEMADCETAYAQSPSRACAAIGIVNRHRIQAGQSDVDIAGEHLQYTPLPVQSDETHS
jgi:hypothetical protein